MELGWRFWVGLPDICVFAHTDDCREQNRRRRVAA
jgi:hypothetical protein